MKKEFCQSGFRFGKRVEKVASGHFFQFLQRSACTPLAYTCPLRSAKSRAQVAAFCKFIGVGQKIFFII